LVRAWKLTQKKDISGRHSEESLYGPLGPLLLSQGEKVLATLSGQEEENGSVAAEKRKPRDFLPSGRNVNNHRHADTFKPSSAKSSEDSFKPVQTPKSEKIIVQNRILEIRPEQTPKDVELISESTIRPATTPPPSSSTTSLVTTPISTELLASADPELLGALGDASPEILAALQEAAPENLKVFLTFAEPPTTEES